MGYLIELDDLRSHIVYPSAYPFPWDGKGDAPPDFVGVTEEADATPEQPPECDQEELNLVFGETTDEKGMQS